MEHLAYCDAKAKELENLLNGSKIMLIRGATGRKLPYGKVNLGEIIYLIENNGIGIIKAKGIVSNVINSEKMTPEQSEDLINQNMDKLKLTSTQRKRWVGKKYLCIVELKDIIEIEPFSYERASNMDDWIIVEDINSIKK